MESEDLKAASRRIADAALLLPPAEREAFVQSACQASPALRASVLELLSLDSDATSAALPDQPSGAAPLHAGASFGRYRVERALGAGAMGSVYLSRDTSLERNVAIKLLAPGLLADATARTLFRAEAHALARLNHAHIAAVYDTGQQDGRDYIVMEYVPGETLAQRLARGPMTVAEATALTLEAARALEEAHEHLIVHRDLKPANIVLTAKGHVKVLDFGLAKLVAGADSTQSLAETQHVAGTPRYMSPEQALGKSVGPRTDLWSLGVIYYEALTGKPPFQAAGVAALLHAITQATPTPASSVRPEVPPEAERILKRALSKDLRDRYKSAPEMAADLQSLSVTLSGIQPVERGISRVTLRWASAGLLLLLVMFAVLAVLFYRHNREQRWAREEAPAQLAKLQDSNLALAAWSVIQRARRDLPADPHWAQIAKDAESRISISSDPPGATVAVQDYLDPTGGWSILGTTPLNNINVPAGFFRWKVSRLGKPDLITGQATNNKIQFHLTENDGAPPGMVYSPGGSWRENVGFLGWLGPYNFPPYFIDRYEVTNRDFQKFMDAGGYRNQALWQNGVSSAEAQARFHDTTGRPGPANWAAGRYPAGQDDDPVSGVSWYEASAYAKWAGKALPVFGQWYQSAEIDETPIAAHAGNFGATLRPVGKSTQVGLFGTYDLAGNVREWVANTVDGDSRFILGGSYNSQPYLSANPEALSPSDRSGSNGFRCVRNPGTLPATATAAYSSQVRDFTRFKPSSDEVFHAYQTLYDYDSQAPLDARTEGIVQDTADWQEQKVSFDTAYNGERINAYLFLPKRVKPPYQTVLFFPSARVYFGSGNSADLEDTQFFNFIVQSGRAVMYPVYDSTYERRHRDTLPSAAQAIELTTHWYKDAARSLDYLKTRPDIDNSRLAYLGVSMGAAQGMIVAEQLQDRLKTILLFDGGFFLDKPAPGADQAEFAARVRVPLLMANGKYDFTFPVDKSQTPLFNLVATDAADKKHLLLDTPHDVTQQRAVLVPEVLDWLNKYLGPVRD